MVAGVSYERWFGLAAGAFFFEFFEPDWAGFSSDLHLAGIVCSISE